MHAGLSRRTRGRVSDSRFGGSGRGRYVPEIGTHEFWTVQRTLNHGWGVGRRTQCHKTGPNLYSERGHAHAPYWSGKEDDPQYQGYRIGVEAFETEAEALKQAIEWTESHLSYEKEKIEKVEAELAQLRERLKAT